MQVDLLEMMVDMYRSQGVSVHLFDHDFQKLEEIDYQFRQQIFKDYDYAAVAANIESIPVNTLCSIEDDLKLFYFIYHFTGTPEEEYKTAYLCLGPVLFQPVSAKVFRTVVEEKQIHTGLFQEVQEFYNRIPLIADAEIWKQTLMLFLVRLAGKPLDYMELKGDAKGLFLSVSADYTLPSDLKTARKAIEDRYDMEAKMLHAVASGNLEQATSFHYQFKQYKLTPRTPDAIRNRKNLLFTFNTLLRKAVQSGGVHPLHIDQLSSQLAIQIEAATTNAQLDVIDGCILRKYCLLVKNYARNAYSSLIQTCLDYIDFHYMEELSLDNLARMCSVSGSYLSSQFKKETGSTVTDYINSTRIRQSLILLNSTGLSIQEISEQCGFSDANYFTRTFKRFQGKSPKSYRVSIRK